MAVLPDTLGDDEGSVRVNFSEYFHPHFLRIDKAMLFALVVRMRADDFPAFHPQSFIKDGLHSGLFLPTFLIGGKAQIAIGHQIDVLWFQWFGGFHFLIESASIEKCGSGTGCNNNHPNLIHILIVIRSITRRRTRTKARPHVQRT